MADQASHAGKVTHVHQTPLAEATIELTPGHPDRTNSATYERAHHFLIYTKKQGCFICGVTVDDLGDPAKNVSGATSLNTHHYPIEWSLAEACDPALVHRDFPQVFDMASLLAFIDTPANLMVLCSTHHLSIEHGVHHLLTQDWIIQRYLRAGYVVAATAADASTVAAQDEAIEHAAGLEPMDTAA